ADVGEEVADEGAALAAGFERPPWFEQRPFLVRQPAAGAQRFAVGGEEFGLVVERVHVRHAAGAEEQDDALRLGGEVRRFWRERVVGQRAAGLVPAVLRPPFGGDRGPDGPNAKRGAQPA